MLKLLLFFRMKLSSLLLLSSAFGGEDSPYFTPVPKGRVNLFEPFDDPNALDGWTFSDNEKYKGGKWAIEPLSKERV